jgi:hypothetical protein
VATSYRLIDWDTAMLLYPCEGLEFCNESYQKDYWTAVTKYSVTMWFHPKFPQHRHSTIKFRVPVEEEGHYG